MFHKIEQPNSEAIPFYSYGFTGQDAMGQHKFHDEDILVELIKEKSGLIDKNSTIRTLTNIQDNTIELQLHYKYTNRDDFVKAMQHFLVSAHGNDLQFAYVIKETMTFIEPDPVLIMDRNYLKELITALKKVPSHPLNTTILNGHLRAERTVCFPFKSF